MAKFRRREGLCLAEGSKVVRELLGSPWQVEALLAMDEKKGLWEDFISEIRRGIPLYSLTGKEWRKLSQDKEPEGIMAVAAVPPPADLEHLLDASAGPILLLHEIHDPSNLGALARTAHWFGIGTLLLGAGSVDYTNPKAVRSSMGSIFHLTIAEAIDFTAILPILKENGYTLVGSEVRKGTAPRPCPPRTALLVGGESRGLPEELLSLCGERWHIPGRGGAESLSLPQAAAIMMYECTKNPVSA
ncbi:MAG: RNA methyltransferase [Deltaproteobacteria bacterium]|nr:RNA methyltransferase [Deltaproteobacteria bacterium]